MKQADRIRPGASHRAALYLRISTDKQEADLQRGYCAEYALKIGLPIIQTVTDTASGALPWRDRAVAPLVAAGSPYTDLIVYEFSRIGRDMVDTLEFLKTCIDHGITVHVAKSSMVVRADISGKIMSTVLALAAEIERDLLRSRTRDALAERQRKIRNEGGFTSKAGAYRTSLGRPKGASGASKLDEHADTLAPLFSANVSDSAIARIYKVDRRTVASARAKFEEGKPCKRTN
jgi:DNA invertase Pin-like site-specific DNA recombinase